LILKDIVGSFLDLTQFSARNRPSQKQCGHPEGARMK
jgi:hypothetical protein